MKCKTLRVRTPASFRMLYYHLRNEKALSARPKYYKKLLAHWNRESGFIIKSYEDFKAAIVVTRHLFVTLGKHATNVIVAMSGSIPPYFSPLSEIDNERLIARSHLGVRPEYTEISLIDADEYGALCRIHEATLSTDDFWRMRKFEYHETFASISEQEREVH